VTYKDEANAQFAKEAMAYQRLDGEEVLNVKWAMQDSNPEAQAREEREFEERAAVTVRAALVSRSARGTNLRERSIEGGSMGGGARKRKLVEYESYDENI